jgi:DNA invertase Pin-like site-specific DNA recombinase
VVNEDVDYESGRTDKREQFSLLFADVHKRKFDTVLVWALDRFSREGMHPTIVHLQRLTSCGVSFHSYTEPLLSTDNELVRDIVLAVMASLAKQEAIRISERTKADMARARAQGKKIGRPAISAELRQRLASRVAEVGAYAAATELGVDRKTAMKYSAADKQQIKDAVNVL